MLWIGQSILGFYSNNIKWRMSRQCNGGDPLSLVMPSDLSLRDADFALTVDVRFL